MIIDNLRKIVYPSTKQQRNPLFLRTLLKEELQNFILTYIYNSEKYKDLIFTGGTVLRKVYGLPRLSEDLDFDYIGDFSIDIFSKDLQSYFISTLQYKEIEVKIANNENTVYLKFPLLLSDLKLSIEQIKSSVLFVRCDFSKEICPIYDTEINSISTSETTFFVKSYDLPTLFANKINAFLKREYYKGTDQDVAFKGRDVYDLVWFIEKSKKDNFQLKPNWKRLLKISSNQSKQEIIKSVIRKSSLISKSKVYEDLAPFIESSQSINVFIDNFATIISRDSSKLL